MLIEFRAENHRSLRDEQVFTMEAGRTSGPASAHVRHAPKYNKPLVTVAAFYGANASGKSNLLSAFAFMRDAVIESHRMWDPAGGVPRDPFAWGQHRSLPSMYEVMFVQQGIRYRYGFVLDDESVLEEWLYAWPEKRKQMWFEREDGFRFGDHLKGEKQVLEQITRRNALFLSTAAQNGHPQLSEVYRWFSSASIEGVAKRSRMRRLPSKARAFNHLLESLNMSQSPQMDLFGLGDDIDPDMIAGVLRLIRVADIGIEELAVRTDERTSRLGLFFRHSSSDVSDAWLPMAEESAGTLTLLSLSLSVLSALMTGGLVVADELERSLHPLLAAYLINQFTDPMANPKGAQLVFTTHDTNLLGSSLGAPALARDQVWLTEKNQDGSTVIYPLTNYKPRKKENVERGYLQGRYGGVPFVDTIDRLTNI